MRNKEISKIEIVKGDITKMDVDAIVNAANTSLLGGGGVDGAIHRAAGKKLLDECRTLNGCKTGQSKITKGYELKARYVIHTVGPVWKGGAHHERELLASCYRSALELAVGSDIRTIAFPSISTGAYRFPFDQAGRVAFTTILNFLQKEQSIEKVFLVCYSEDDFERLKQISAEFL
jgi:O-acetyl-ADP-ribose deacetylase (regulator of RNase III)